MAKHPKPNTSPQSQVDICGIVMPIAGFGDYDTEHWRDVMSIVERAIVGVGKHPNPVWESTDTDIIQGRIVRNLYENHIVVCDISGLNPNVMFELGLRLAFKKPVVIVVDDTTKIPFDTNVIEHIIYDTALQFQKIESFMQKLSEKISSVCLSVVSDSYVPYIDAFGVFSKFEPNHIKVEFDELVINKLEQISASVSRLNWEQQRIRERDNLESSSMQTWTENRINLLKKYWDEGKTASEIGELIGVSRNTVIGKAHRLDLQTRSLPGMIDKI